MNYQQPDFNQPKIPNKKRYVSVMFFVILVTVFIYGSHILSTGSNEIEVSNGDRSVWNKLANIFQSKEEKAIEEMTIENDPDYKMPAKEKDRLDILILGIRGEEEEITEEVGSWLTDTIMILSYDKKTGKTSLVSIPRDLYLRIYGSKKSKINEGYEIGALRRNGLGFSKKLFSRISGVYIDNAVVLDFSSFKKIIDDLGGIDIELDKPFTERTQWGYAFNLPKGKSHLDGQTALYYVRSRFSSSDFDRAQRQQRVIMAIKNKIMELDLISDPIKSLSILNSIRSKIDTDLNIWDAGSLMSLAEQFNSEANIKRYVITTENLVYESHLNNIYVLLPKGDNLALIKQLFQDILK